MSDNNSRLHPGVDQEEPEMRKNRMGYGLTKRHWIVRYGLALIVFGLLIGYGQGVAYFIPRINQTVPIVVALVGTAWYLGRGPGILFSVLLEGITIWYATIPPDSTVAKAWFGYISVFALYIFLVYVI